MTQPLRILLKTLLWALAVICGLALAIFAVNAFDEDVSPQTAALLKPPDNPYAPEENLYIALVGFDAPEGESVVTVGQARIAENEIEAVKILNDPQAAAERLERVQNRKRATFRGKSDLCHPVTDSCWEGVEEHKQEINDLLRENQELYRRYLALHALRGYFESEASGYFMTLAYSPGALRALFLTNAALRVKTGTTVQTRNAALLDLRNDVETWRRMLVGNGTLVSKMLAIVNLHGDYALLGDLIADPSIDLVPLSTSIEDILTRVAPDDWKLQNLFASEFRMAAPFYDQLRHADTSVMRQLSRPDGEQSAWWELPWAWLQGHFLKVNATENIHALAMIELQKTVQADPRELLTAQEAFHQWTLRNFGFGPSLLYNPVGKALVWTSAYDGYPLRVYDVAAQARGVRLAYEIRKQRVALSDIREFSSRHPEWATHPVNGEPFAWDPEARQLRVPTMGKSPADRRFTIPVYASVP